MNCTGWILCGNTHKEHKMKNILSCQRDGFPIWKIAIHGFCIACLLASMAAPGGATEPAAAKPMTMAEIVAAAKPEDWRALDAENTIYVELAGGRVVIELAPVFAPQHAANVKALVREHYFDGLAIIRVQDNYVVQWGDPEAEDPLKARKMPAEFDRAIDAKVPFTLLPDGDVYAKEVGFSDGFPVARDQGSGRMWLTHGYGMVGAGRGDTSDSGGGTEIYVVIGQVPRHLDRNCTLFGRVLQGMELLSSLPRASGPMGFYEKAEHYVPLRSIRVAADVPPAERSDLEVMRTDTDTFQQVVEARRNRSEEWFLSKAGRIELCNIPVPLRKKDK
jgi:peptidylprolyl isomerase